VLQLKIEHCSRDEIDKLSESLETTAALSITMMDKQDDPILEPELGTTPLWPNVVIHALYAKAHDVELASQMLSADYPHLNVSIEPVPEQDWEHVCKIDFKPQRFGQRLWICPSWLTPPEPEAVNLILDPGLAFGTGTHPTTSLCLTWLEHADLQSKKIIDYGCGSGILALAALKLGAQHASAVDIDEQALIATKNNADNNYITNKQLTIGFPDTLNTKVDVLIANILLTPLINLRDQFHQLLNIKGTLVVSGLLESQAEDLVNAYQDIFICHKSVIQDGWALVEFICRTETLRKALD
jgi:ribosomal protein L11 methyltransferase